MSEKTAGGGSGGDKVSPRILNGDEGRTEGERCEGQGTRPAAVVAALLHVLPSLAAGREALGRPGLTSLARDLGALEPAWQEVGRAPDGALDARDRLGVVDQEPGVGLRDRGRLSRGVGWLAAVGHAARRWRRGSPRVGRRRGDGRYQGGDGRERHGCCERGELCLSYAEGGGRGRVVQRWWPSEGERRRAATPLTPPTTSSSHLYPRPADDPPGQAWPLPRSPDEACRAKCSSERPRCCRPPARRPDASPSHQPDGRSPARPALASPRRRTSSESASPAQACTPRPRHARRSHPRARSSSTTRASSTSSGPSSLRCRPLPPPASSRSQPPSSSARAATTTTPARPRRPAPSSGRSTRSATRPSSAGPTAPSSRRSGQQRPSRLSSSSTRGCVMALSPSLYVRR